MIFADSSAVVKLYMAESESSFVKTFTHFYVSSIAKVECISAFWRKSSLQHIGVEEARRTSMRFTSDLNNAEKFKVFPITDEIVDLACVLLEKYRLRAYDAMQLAHAVNLNRIAQGDEPVEFLSFDKKLNIAARQEGLRLVLQRHFLN